jgi:hypothetical protein
VRLQSFIGVAMLVLLFGLGLWVRPSTHPDALALDRAMVKETKFFRLAEHGVRAGAGIDVLREAIALVEERAVAPIAA